MISKNDRYGAQRIFIDQVAALHALGHEVIVAARGTEGYVAESVRAFGVPYHGLSLKGLRDILYLKKLVGREKIDVIHTTLDRADYTGLLVSKLTGRPVVSTMMVPRCHLGYRFMDRVAVLSRKQQQVLVTKGVDPAKVDVIRPGIDVERFANPDARKREQWRERIKSGKYSMVFCHISSMLPRKAHTVSLEVVAECGDRGENPLLVIIGDPLTGEYYESLKDRIARSGLTGHVVFTGWTPDIPEVLSLSHFTILPSENEALGVVLMEGMAAGTPIIAREGEGGAELVEDYGAGFLYREREGVAALAGRIVTLYRDRVLYAALSGRCRETAVNEFSMTAFGKKLLGLYRHAQ